MKYKMKYYIINHRDNKMEGYQSSLYRSDDNFNFNYDNNDDAQNFFRMFNLLFYFIFLFFRCLKN